MRISSARFPDVDVAFDATSAYAHAEHARDPRRARDPLGRPDSRRPRAGGDPRRQHRRPPDAPDVNLVTCGAQATVPVVAAIAAVTDLPYAEIVSTISARSAGPGTRANIDEFTCRPRGRSRASAAPKRGKAIMLLNPADPPVLMRNAIYADIPGADAEAVIAAVDEVVGPSPPTSPATG